MTFPTKAQWLVAIHKGFRSDGAMCSSNRIYFTRIGNGDLTYPPLPVDLHNYRYFIGGDHADRIAADHEFLEFMYDVIEERSWRIVRGLAQRRALKYFHLVRSPSLPGCSYRYKEQLL